MALTISPRPVPRIVLSRELGINAAREARKLGYVAVARGAFVEPLTAAKPWEQTEHLALAGIAAATLRLSPKAVISHASAALLHGLWVLDPETRTHVTHPTRVHRPPDALRRHCLTLPDDDVTEVDGRRVTTVARTIVDCAKSMHPREALPIADSGMRLLLAPSPRNRTVDLAAMQHLRTRLLELVEMGPHHGRRQAREIIRCAHPLAEAPYESVVRWVAISHGLPLPTLQQRFDIDRKVFFVDLCWHLQLIRDGQCVGLVVLLVEYDGDIKYRAGDGLDPLANAQHAVDTVMAEKRREDLLRTVRHATIIRLDRHDVRDADALFRKLCASLPARTVAQLRPVPALLGPLPKRRG
ncbi:hypothetical protein [Georgenia sp. MJ170]|uniref:hypothetical protein n=1 Tax=Georgenia sunbinii TaxID=3117728 RepID=UPI002F261568